MKVSDDLSLFAWGLTTNLLASGVKSRILETSSSLARHTASGGMLANRPSYFAQSSGVSSNAIGAKRLREPFGMTHAGLKLTCPTWRREHPVDGKQVLIELNCQDRRGLPLALVLRCSHDRLVERFALCHANDRHGDDPFQATDIETLFCHSESRQEFTFAFITECDASIEYCECFPSFACSRKAGQYLISCPRDVLDQPVFICLVSFIQSDCPFVIRFRFSTRHGLDWELIHQEGSLALMWDSTSRLDERLVDMSDPKWTMKSQAITLTEREAPFTQAMIRARELEMHSMRPRLALEVIK